MKNFYETLKILFLFYLKHFLWYQIVCFLDRLINTAKKDWYVLMWVKNIRFSTTFLSVHNPRINLCKSSRGWFSSQVLARCMCWQDLARRSFWQDRARASCKIFQVLARPIICKIEQEDLSSTFKINKDQCLARLSKMVLAGYCKKEQVPKRLWPLKAFFQESLNVLKPHM